MHYVPQLLKFVTSASKDFSTIQSQLLPNLKKLKSAANALKTVIFVGVRTVVRYVDTAMSSRKPNIVHIECLRRKTQAKITLKRLLQ